MKKRTRVLHLQPKCSVRIADLQEEIIASLPVSEFEVVTAYLMDTPETSSSGLESQSERIKYFNFTKKDTKGLRLKLMWTLWKFCNQEKFDVVITHRFKALDIMMKLNKFLKIPHCIGVVHNLDDFNRFYRKLNAFFFLDDKWTIVTVSKAVNDYLCNIKFAFKPGQVITINNAIDTESLTSRLLPKTIARNKLGIDNDAFVFGSTGRLVTVKGYIYLIRAFEKLHKALPDKNIKLVIIGDGKLKTELTHYINEHHLQDNVFLPGEIIDAKLYMSAYDVFVLSSLSEGLPLVLLEAMTARVPVIATNVGGVPSVLNKDDPLIEPKNIKQLFNEMFRLYNMTSNERHDIGEQLFLRVSSDFDTKLYRQTYLELIRGD